MTSISVEYRKGTELIKKSRYDMYSKDEVVMMAKHLGLEMKADEIWISYVPSGKTIGYFERKGSRWYRM